MAPAVPDGNQVAKSAPEPHVSNDFLVTLEWYYRHFFPSDLFVRWLSYGSKDTFSNREISFTLHGDIYLRWQSFVDSADLVTNLTKHKPVKMDIGAVYNHPPRKRHSISQLLPKEKELVFDIDMTDYEDVIGNLGGGSAVEMCDRNWTYMATAVKVLDAALREDFGFKHIMWVYSGRRGIHCWVADARARKMPNEQRSAVADYLHLRFEGKDNVGRIQHDVTVPLHPSLKRAKRYCDETFREFVLGDQGMLDGDERTKEMVAHIPNRMVAEQVMERVGYGSGLEKWERIEKELQHWSKGGQRQGKPDYSLRATADYVMFRHTYPRLDVNVSKEINHLLKAPFCVHPKTGRVCVPFRAKDVDSFVPGDAAPEFKALVEDGKKVGGEVQWGNGEMTKRMREAIEVFKEFVMGVEEEVRKIERENKLGELDRRNAVELMAM